MKKSIRLAAVAIAIALAFGAGAVVYERLGANSPTPPVPVTVEAPHAATTPRGSVPDALPDFTLRDLDNHPHSIREWAGRPLVVNFWATWCGPCRDEIPLFERLRQERSADGLEIVGIAVDFRKDVRDFVAKTPIHYPILVGEDDGVQVAALLGIVDLALPFTVFVDRKGRILVLRLGQVHEDQAKLILDTLREVDSGSLELSDAQARVAAGLRAFRPAESPRKAGNPA
jgi:thiol-disulfide isomerase/thioredoxin